MNVTDTIRDHMKRAQEDMREAQRLLQMKPNSTNAKARAKAAGETWRALDQLSIDLIGREETGIMANDIDRDIAWNRGRKA